MRLLFFLSFCIVPSHAHTCIAGTCAHVTTIPLPCPVHTTSVQGAMGLQQCVCAPGAYGNRTGVACDVCQQGTFSNTTSASECTGCPYGTYMDKTGASVCWDCALGAIANVIGAQDDSFCTEPRFVVQLVVARMTLSEQETLKATTLLAVALGLPASQYNRVSILSTRRRNLLSTGTTTFKIVAKTQEEANLFANLLTYQFLLNNVFRNSTITPPAAIISVEVVDLKPQPTPTPAPAPASNSFPVEIVAGAAGGGVILTVVVILLALWKTGKFNNTSQGPTIRVRIAGKRL